MYKKILMSLTICSSLLFLGACDEQSSENLIKRTEIPQTFKVDKEGFDELLNTVDVDGMLDEMDNQAEEIVGRNNTLMNDEDIIPEVDIPTNEITNSKTNQSQSSSANSSSSSTSSQSQLSPPINTTGTIEKYDVPFLYSVDGDTTKIEWEGKPVSVRHLLIDTPETKHPKKGEEPFGREASARAKELLENARTVSIEFDVGQRYDHYERLLAYVYADGVDVSEQLLKEGLARVDYVKPPNTRHLDKYKKAEQEAKSKGLGIWGM